MEEQIQQGLQQSGIEEALHPAIGNGVGREKNVHAASLKTIDPTKTLENRFTRNISSLSPSVEDNAENDAVPEKPEVTKSEEEASAKPKQAIKKTTKPPVSGETEAPKARLTTRKKTTSKSTQASKRIRKVAKIEEELKSAEETVKTPIIETKTPDQLSPFTSWLKNLRGSEYVHPFDDDFAFQQQEGSGKEGISETFAELLALQGYRDQAIEMYSRLMEKFPEKSRFFAAKIEALK